MPREPKVRDAGERRLIEILRRKFPPGPASGGVRVGIGDDTAVLDGAGTLLATQDLLVEGRDFLLRLHPARLLGRKSLRVNLSDIGAMGGRPLYALLGLGLPDGLPLRWVRDFLDGFAEAAEASGTKLAGGDLSGSGEVFVAVTVLGRARRPVLRSGAKPGDILWVSGTLGDAAEGLRLLRRGRRLGDGPVSDIAIEAFLDPVPPLEAARRLGEDGLATAMIDVSDGVSTDLGHLCDESRAGAEVDLARIPLSAALAGEGRRAAKAALHGGEDFQVLFTVRPENAARVERLARRFALTPIGRITARRGVRLIDADGKRSPLRPLGYEHFKK